VASCGGSGRGGPSVRAGSCGGLGDGRAGAGHGVRARSNAGRPVGTDTLAGGAGEDFLVDGPCCREFRRDVLGGGAGNDEVTAFNFPASRDIVACVAGRDSAEVDRRDRVGDDCERVLLFR
jgi:hypothetical protein